MCIVNNYVKHLLILFSLYSFNIFSTKTQFVIFEKLHFWSLDPMMISYENFKKFCTQYHKKGESFILIAAKGQQLHAFKVKWSEITYFFALEKWPSSSHSHKRLRVLNEGKIRSDG